MKKFFLIAGMITAFSISANCQTAQHKDRFDGIDLTAQQRTSIDSVRKIYDDKRAEVKKDETLSKEAKAEKMKELRKEQVGIIDGFLTADQKKQLKKEQKEKAKSAS
jgi:hypothetical protein